MQPLGTFHAGTSRLRIASTTNEVARNAANELIMTIGQGRSRQSSSSVSAMDDDDEDQDGDDDDDDDEDGYVSLEEDEGYSPKPKKVKKARSLLSSLRKTSVRKEKTAADIAKDMSVVCSISVRCI